MRGDEYHDEDKKGSRKRSKGKMCCITFLRNASIFINYVIVIAAFIASVLFIYIFLDEQDTDVRNPAENFYLFRASVTIEMILSIMVNTRKWFVS